MHFFDSVRRYSRNGGTTSSKRSAQTASGSSGTAFTSYLNYPQATVGDKFGPQIISVIASVSDAFQWIFQSEYLAQAREE
ncbi:hypothetical protein H1R20_g5643, partial [Candolleomyces eurysporus]